jgi:hypothetical protein
MGIPYPSGVPFFPESIAVREMTISEAGAKHWEFVRFV